jgi:hypothetical protein
LNTRIEANSLGVCIPKGQILDDIHPTNLRPNPSNSIQIHPVNSQESRHLLTFRNTTGIPVTRPTQGREAWEIEGWPCGRASKKRSGHPRVTSAQLHEVVLAAGRYSSGSSHDETGFRMVVWYGI